MILCDVLIAGSGTMANLLAMLFADIGKRVAISGYLPSRNILKNGMEFDSAIKKRRKIKILPQNIFVNPFNDPIQQGQIGIFVRTRNNSSSYLNNLILKNDKLVVFATKTFSNNIVINDLKPVLERTSDIVFFSTQNGIHPEIEIDCLLHSNGIKDFRLYRGVAHGGVFPINQICLRSTIDRYTIGYWGKGDDDREFIHGLRKIKKCFSEDIIPAEISLGNSYKINSVKKAVANYLSSISFIFCARLGEILDNKLLEKLSDEKVEETIDIATNDMGLLFDPKEVMENAARICELLRYHYPSMAVDGLRSFCNPHRAMDTEIKHLDRQFVDSSKRESPLNKFCADLVQNFTDTFNEIRLKNLKNAVIFGLRFVTRNRALVGLPPYEFFKAPFPGISENLELIRTFKRNDTGNKTCKSSSDVCSKIITHYNELKTEYES